MKKIFAILSFIFCISISSCSETSVSPSVNPSIGPSVNPSVEPSINEYVVNFDSKGGSDVVSQTVNEGDKVIKPVDPIKDGYLFVMWTYNNTEWDFDTVITSNITLVATWSIINYNITYLLDGGTNSPNNPDTFTIEDNIVLEAANKEGYTFIGWTYNDEPITTINNLLGDIILLANWRINSYKVVVTSMDENMGSATGSGEYEYNSEIHVIAIPNVGYSFKGWYENGKLIKFEKDWIISVNRNYNLVASFELIDYKISYELDGGVNDANNPPSYTIIDSINLLPATKDGFEFLGWVYKEEIISIVGNGMHEDIVLVAAWALFVNCEVSVSYDENMGSVIGAGEYKSGDQVTLTATPFEGYLFKGWYDTNNNLLCEENIYKFTIGSSDVYLTAYFRSREEEEKEQWDIAHGVIPTLDETTNTITYGIYPQSVVDDDTLISELNNLTDEDKKENNWYFYNDEYYVKAHAKPFGEYYFDNGEVITKDKTYWFKCEAITWNILSNNNGEYFILASTLVEIHNFYNSKAEREIEDNKIYANNYKYSDVRAYLNGYDGSSYNANDYTNKGFIDIAFTFNSEHILESDVDNSAATTKTNNNPYVCDNTLDKIFLLSYQDYLNTSYGFCSDTGVCEGRKARTSDYVRASCAYNEMDEKENINNGIYWTRSPSKLYSYVAWNIAFGGHYDEVDVNHKTFCIRPAMKITL